MRRGGDKGVLLVWGGKRKGLEEEERKLGYGFELILEVRSGRDREWAEILERMDSRMDGYGNEAEMGCLMEIKSQNGFEGSGGSVVG